jgi:hypothetical protein
MGEPVRHRRTKGAATDMFEPKATAPHLDSTPFGPGLRSARRLFVGLERTSITNPTTSVIATPTRTFDLIIVCGWFGHLSLADCAEHFRGGVTCDGASSSVSSAARRRCSSRRGRSSHQR